MKAITIGMISVFSILGACRSNVTAPNIDELSVWLSKDLQSARVQFSVEHHGDIPLHINGMQYDLVSGPLPVYQSDLIAVDQILKKKSPIWLEFDVQLAQPPLLIDDVFVLQGVLDLSPENNQITEVPFYLEAMPEVIQ